MPRVKDVQVGSYVVKTRGEKKYVYLVRRFGKRVLSAYVGPYFDEDVLRRFIEYHRACVQRLEARLAFHREHLELAERELERVRRFEGHVEGSGAVVPNK